MRNTIILLGAVLSLTACGLVWSADEMTEGEKASVLAGLDEACPTQWCAGGTQYDFTEVACTGDRSSCQLSFDATIDGRLHHGVVNVSGYAQILTGTDVDPSFERAVGRALSGWHPSEDPSE